MKRLAAQGLINYQPYRPVSLTPLGERLAVEMVRRHRLLETFLAEHLGYGWDEVHDEAERLEHAVSATFVERIDRALGRPTTDPHGTRSRPAPVTCRTTGRRCWPRCPPVDTGSAGSVITTPSS